MRPWKIQKFFGDVVYDLRNRGLLPVAVLLLIGLLAVPILISRTGNEASAPPNLHVAPPSELAPENQAAVVTYDPGLREYRERLKELRSKDPFRQQYAAAAAVASELSTGTGGAELSTAGDAPSGVGTGSTGGSPGGGAGSSPAPSGGEPKLKLRLYYYETDVQIGEADGELKRRNRVQPMAFLPNEETPIVGFLGVGGEDRRAVFVVSSDAQVQGDGTSCLPNPDDCQMLVMKKGQQVDLLYEPTGTMYRLRIADIRRVVKTQVITPKQRQAIPAS